ncbi:hypothetical protein ACQJBY_049861 [Aegilops geniculata]
MAMIQCNPSSFWPIFPLSSSSAWSADRPAAEISWMTLERFVFRRDDDGSFPDEAAAPMRAKSITSLGDPFTVALLPAAPPAFSRLYVQWPRGPRDYDGEDTGAELLAAHQDLLLFSLTSEVSLNDSNIDSDPYRQDYFVFNTAVGVKSRLKRLPACTLPIVLKLWGDDVTMDRQFNRDTIGIYRARDDFMVVQLAKFSVKAKNSAMGAELCVFRSPLRTDGSDVVAKGMWNILNLPIQHTKEEFTDLTRWSTYVTIISKDCIIWVDYHQGGILSYKPRYGVETTRSSVTYSRLPINNRPEDSVPSGETLEMYRSLCVTGKEGNRLKFVDIAREDGAFFGPLAPGSSFTITCYTLASSEDNGWHKEAVITSKKFRYLACRNRRVPHNAVPMFPLVNRDEPNLIHFIVSEPRDNVDKLSVVVIDVINETIVSVSPYIHGEEDLCGEDADMVKHRCRILQSFLPVSSQTCSRLFSKEV